MKRSQLTLSLVLCALALPAHAWREVGNGGDEVAQSFVTTAYRMLNLLKRLPAAPEGLSLTTLEQAIDSTYVVSEEKLFLNDPSGQPSERDALNFPGTTPPSIRVSRARWQNAAFTEKAKLLLTLHEYLGILGLERNTYVVSAKLENALSVSQSAPVQIFSQALVNGQEGLTLGAAAELCDRYRSMYRRSYFMVYCTFETKQNLSVEVNTEFTTDYRFLGYTTRGRSSSSESSSSSAASVGLSVVYGRRGFGFEASNEVSESAGSSESSYSQQPIIREVQVPYTAYKTLDRSTYGLRVWGLGDLANAPWRVLESSLSLGQGLVSLDFASADEAIDACYDSLLNLQIARDTRGYYDRAKCTAELRGDRYHYLMLSQNPLLPL